MSTPQHGQNQPHDQQPPWPPPGYPPQYPPPGYPPGYQPPGPPGPPPRRRHTLRTVLLTLGGVVGALIVIGIIAAAVSGPSHHGTAATVVSTPTTASATPTTSAPPPPPAANPAGTITGSCDVSLSSSLNGQNYLTASVTANNTGNVGTIVRIRVAWPLQGFPPITRTRTIRTAAGGSKQVQFNAPVNEAQVSQFQDMQLAASGDPCHYKAKITGTYGQPG